jgi:hypothetical protein
MKFQSRQKVWRACGMPDTGRGICEPAVQAMAQVVELVRRLVPDADKLLDEIKGMGL